MFALKKFYRALLTNVLLFFNIKFGNKIIKCKIHERKVVTVHIPNHQPTTRACPPRVTTQRSRYSPQSRKQRVYRLSRVMSGEVREKQRPFLGSGWPEMPVNIHPTIFGYPFTTLRTPRFLLFFINVIFSLIKCNFKFYWCH